MNFLNILPATFIRLSSYAATGIRNISTYRSPLCIAVTNALLAEPLKKKKKLDPAIIRQREEKRKKRLEKRIRQLSKISQLPKPVKELEAPVEWIEEKEQRTRKLPPISEEEAEARILLFKEWARYKTNQHLKNIQRIDRLIYSQQRALDELRLESEELYNEAIQIDQSFIPYSAQGPVHTPPIEDYDSPDGEYIDVTRKYEGEME